MVTISRHSRVAVRIPGQPVELPTAVFLLGRCQRVQMRFDHLIGEKTTREALRARGEVERGVRVLLRGRCERDQLLFQDFG